jgi:hypothetical protein
MNANQNNNKKLSKVISTKLSIEDYNAFLTITKLEYEAGLIKQQSTSELLRFTIRHILNQIHNNLIYPILEEEQQEQEQKKAQNNQQQLVNPVILPSTTVAASHQHQPPNNISRRNSLVSQKMTPWKLSSLLSTEKTRHTFW